MDQYLEKVLSYWLGIFKFLFCDNHRLHLFFYFFIII